MSGVFDEVRRAVAAEEPSVLFTVLDGERAGAKLFVRETGETAGDGPPALAEQAVEVIGRGRSRVIEHEGVRVFADVYGPPPRLLVFGAVDTAEALCAAAGALGWTTIVADARARFATAERLPSAGELIVAWPEQALAQVGPDRRTAVVVLTHEERFDIPAVAGALAGDAFYVGALGSRRTQHKRRMRLLESGLSESDLERLHGPCGLDIGAESPAETALSILAEILAVRAGRGGGSLRTSRERIHPEAESEASPQPA
jgi:xanthine dehydrogenase accessory factor